MTSPENGRASSDDEYQGIARWYDPLLTIPMWRIRRHIVKTAEKIQLESLLDIGCGTGQQLRMLQRLELKLTGSDISPAMLAVAREKSRSGIDYLRADSRELPIGDDQFHGALISMSLHEMSAELRAATVEEALRVTRGDGWLLIADYCRLRGWWSRLMSHAVRFVERRTEGDHYRNYLEWMNSGALEGLLQRKGLKIEESHRFLSGNIAVVLARAAPNR